MSSEKDRVKVCKDKFGGLFSCRFNNRSNFSIGEGLLKPQLIKVRKLRSEFDLLHHDLFFLMVYDFCQ